MIFATVSLCSCSKGAGDNYFDIVNDPCQTIVIAPASDSSSEEIASIADAIDLWQQVGNIRLTLVASEDAQIVPVVFQEAALASRALTRMKWV